MKNILLLIFLTVVTFFVEGKSKVKDESVAAKAARIHESALTVDTHCDTPIGLSREGFNLALRHDAKESGTKVDLPRMKEGGLDAQFFAVFIGQGP